MCRCCSFRRSASEKRLFSSLRLDFKQATFRKTRLPSPIFMLLPSKFTTWKTNVNLSENISENALATELPAHYFNYCTHSENPKGDYFSTPPGIIVSN